MNLQGPLWRFTGVRPAAWVFFAFLYIPIIILVIYSFNDSKLVTVWGGFSTEWYVVMINNQGLILHLLYSGKCVLYMAKHIGHYARRRQPLAYQQRQSFMIFK